jgi:NAD(P)-dependent dehydrogenase (short-subunit alcohol dehydrogenase family)
MLDFQPVTMQANKKNIVLICDVVDRVFADLGEHHDSLNVLVNNAGVAGPTAPVDTHDEDGWDVLYDPAGGATTRSTP